MGMLRNLWRTILAGFMLLLAATGRPQGVEHADPFDGPDGQRPTGWKIVGALDEAYWFRRDSAFNTGDGENYQLGTAWAVLDRPGSQDWSNYTVGVDFRMLQPAGVVCLAARWRNERSHYYAALEASESASGTVTRVHIYKTSGGTTRALGSAGAPEGLVLPKFYSNPTGTPTRFDFQVDGPKLRVLVNGNEMLVAQDSEFPTGTIALGQELNEVAFDNLRVTESFDLSASVPIGNVAGAASGLPPATGGTTAWRILVIEKKALTDAQKLAAELTEYKNVEVVAEGLDQYSVYVGRHATQDAASKEADKLSSDGYILADSAPRSFALPGSAPPPTAPPVATPVSPGSILPTPTITHKPTLDEELDELAKTAARIEGGGNLSGALDVWYRVKPKAPVGTAMWQLADENIRRLNLEIARQQKGPGGPGNPGDQSGPPIALIAGIVVGVVALAGVAFFVMKKKGSSVAAPKAAPAAKSSAPPAGAGLLAPIAVAPPRGSPKAEPTPRAGASTLEVGPEARIRPGTVSPAPQHEPTPRAPLAPPRAEPTPHVAPRPEPTPRMAPPPPQKPTEESGVKLDFLFDNAPQSAAPSTPKREDTSEFFEPPPPDPNAPRAEVTPAMGAPAAADQAFFYTQDFENEPIGASPANWKGDYEYAALKIHGEGTGGGSRCLRFDKKNGVGSAYYSCRFPNASGRIGVEFDMRCDDKNKYLLGFYIEKDEDFRQSIHTIVHRTNSNAKPTLRLQNEACNYDFGRWTHIRFEIDLPRHIVDGYVDEKPIAMGTRLNNCPKYVNTLSIRDNLATAGVLLIDNIKIYRL